MKIKLDEMFVQSRFNKHF